MAQKRSHWKITGSNFLQLYHVYCERMSLSIKFNIAFEYLNKTKIYFSTKCPTWNKNKNFKKEYKKSTLLITNNIVLFWIVIRVKWAQYFVCQRLKKIYIQTFWLFCVVAWSLCFVYFQEFVENLRDKSILNGFKFISSRFFRENKGKWTLSSWNKDMVKWDFFVRLKKIQNESFSL